MEKEPGKQHKVYNISTRTEFKPGGRANYDIVNLGGDGHFVFTGDFDLTIGKLHSSKFGTSDYAYDFLICSPVGEPASVVNIKIGELCNTVYVKAAGEDGTVGVPGDAGKDGGKGGDAADSNGRGGRGGDGGDGGKGGKGGDGGFAPDVTLVCEKKAGDVEIIVLNRDDKPGGNISYGGKGGKGGPGGKGGSGGHGGKHGNNSFASGGKSGDDGDPGDDGVTQDNDKIKFC